MARRWGRPRRARPGLTNRRAAATSAPPVARWVTLVEQGDYLDFELVASPVFASKTLDEQLWWRCAGAVVTSAPLTALGRFDRFLLRSGAPPSAVLEVVPSPFDFAGQGVLAVPRRAAEGNRAELHTERVIELLPELIGGSADLGGSNLTVWPGCRSISEHPDGNYIHYGVREFGMTAIMNGIALHGGFIPYGGTFLIFMEYARNAVRLAALMKQHSILVYTHDSIGQGEDGPTHQPVEQIANLRTTPNMSVWRPADAVETAIKPNAVPTSNFFISYPPFSVILCHSPLQACLAAHLLVCAPGQGDQVIVLTR